MTTEHEGAPPSGGDHDVDGLARRVDEAWRAVRALDGPARAVALELKDALDALHREALVRIVRLLRAGEGALDAVVADEVVHAVLIAHGLVRTDCAAGVIQVLDAVRPHLQAAGADARLVGMDGAVAVLRLEGALAGCGEVAQVLRHDLGHLLTDAVAGLAGIAEAPADPGVAFIPLASIGRRR